MIYLDNNATTRLDDDVVELFSNFSNPLNPSSIHHYGREARKLLEKARSDLARSLGVNLGRESYKIIFTSGGTEANNLVLKNHLDFKVLYSSIEHPSVLNICKNLDDSEELPVDENGVVKIDVLKDKLKLNKDKNILITVMAANNETGVIQPIEEISILAKEYGAKFHTDAVQAFGKLKIDFKNLDADFISLSAHKIGGMTGIGALVAKENNFLKAQNIGGGQERGERSGTENLIGAMSFAIAANNALMNIDNYQKTTSRMRDYIENEIEKLGGQIIGKESKRLPNTSMIASDVLSDLQLIKFDSEGIMVSNGSACSSGKVKNSHVLDAMNKREIAKNVIRVSFSANNSMQDAKKFVETWIKINNKLI